MLITATDGLYAPASDEEEPKKDVKLEQHVETQNIVVTQRRAMITRRITHLVFFFVGLA